MFDFSTITEVALAKGSHSSPEAGMCFMEMAAWFAGEAHSDKPACACPVLGRYGINLNDQMPDDARQRLLLPMVPLMAGTADKASEQKRAEFLAMWAVTKVLSFALRLRGFDSHAARCEAAKDLSEAKAAAYAAADAANAAYAAANAADAAADAAYAAAYAAYAADAAADAAAYAAADAADEIWQVAVEGLRQAILIGRHDGFDAAIDLTARREALKQLVSA